MNTFILKSNRYIRVNEAVAFCNELLSSGRLQTFIAEIQQKDFTMTDRSGAYIAGRVLDFVNSEQVIYVKFYKSRNPFSKAYGYYTKSRPFDVNINTRKINRSTGSFVATLVHEMIHAVDGLDKEYNFGHGDNSSESKDDTAPYWIGSLASMYYGDQQTAENYPKTVRTPWYKRLWKWLF